MSFTGHEGQWSARLGNLRNTVRQHLIAEQLASHLDGIRTVLDVGCGQGTQALVLAGRGLDVTGLDTSAALLQQLERAAAKQHLRVETIEGDVSDLDQAVGGRIFDLTCAHGLLMYLDDARDGLAALVERTRPGGRLSFTVRNGDALAYRPGIRGEYAKALAAFDRLGYRNELGIDARAHTRAAVVQWCTDLDLGVEAWYGVRVLTDGVAADLQPDSVDLEACLAAETVAGRKDPYRALGSMLHFVVTRAVSR